MRAAMLWGAKQSNEGPLKSDVINAILLGATYVRGLFNTRFMRYCRGMLSFIMKVWRRSCLKTLKPGALLNNMDQSQSQNAYVITWKYWDVITDLFPNFNVGSVEILESFSNFIPYFIAYIILTLTSYNNTTKQALRHISTMFKPPFHFWWWRHNLLNSLLWCPANAGPTAERWYLSRQI